ncbi:MAG: dihydropteroate synthase [Armatimonadetes bacterium]|nr:dihydropteroate synthase [Armatimonadota bacterium]
MFQLPADRPAIMGVLNVTPDSFSDGGRYADFDLAIAHAHDMVDQGADLIDVGGESTRPGAEPVDEAEELRRVVPIVEALSSQGVCVSVDTSKAEVARASLRAGAQVVNDVTALKDPRMADLCADAGCFVCLMHMRGEPRTMQENPAYSEVVEEVRDHLVLRAESAEMAGVRRDRIWIDPGIGFGKSLEHNLILLRNLGKLVRTEYPVLVGVSRKSFIGKLLGGALVDDRHDGTLAAQVLAQVAGARVIRAHDVRAARRAAIVTQAIMNA